MLCAHCESPNVTIHAESKRGIDFFCCIECKNYYVKLKRNELLDKIIADCKLDLQLLEQDKHSADPEVFVLMKRNFLLRIMMWKQIKTRDKILIQRLRANLLESMGAILELYNQRVQIGKITEAEYIDIGNSQKEDIETFDSIIDSI